MKRLSSLKVRLRAGVGLAAMAILIYGSSSVFVAGEDTKAPAKASDAKMKEPKPAKKKLTGAELYAVHCNRCHPERYATEWNSAQWKTLMTHMRVRANLPPSQAKAILRYLQEDSGN